MTERPHGYRRYQTDRCRCFTCRLAKSEYRQRCEAGLIDGYVDATPVREHVAALRSAGYGTRRLENIAGVARCTLRRLPGADKVHRKVATALLAIPLGPPPPPSRYVPAVGTQRRVQALGALGWSLTYQAKRAGMGQPQLSRILAAPSLAPWNAAKFSALYDELSMRVPPPSRWVTQVREIARLALHFPPLAWDDETIDDPDALPCLLPPIEPVDRNLELLVQQVFAGHPVKATLEAKREIIRRMPDRKPREIAPIVGTTAAYVGVLRSQLEAS